jgi:hypothetical protein
MATMAEFRQSESEIQTVSEIQMALTGEMPMVRE